MKTRNLFTVGVLALAFVFSGVVEARNSRNDNNRNNNRSAVNHNNHYPNNHNNYGHRNKSNVHISFNNHHHGNCCAGYVSRLPNGARRVMLNGSIFFNLGNLWFEVHGSNGYRVIDCPIAWHF